MLHMKAAYVYAAGSHCVRRKVGCLIVKNNTPIAVGYNGTPSGDDNVCEDVYGNTKSNVIHAEDNALRKLQGFDVDLTDAYLFVTTAPCVDCADKIITSGIRHVFYSETYRCEKGIQKLIDNGITVKKIDVLTVNNIDKTT